METAKQLKKHKSELKRNLTKEERYVEMAISPARDKRLSYKARGILYYLLTKPDKWQCQVYDLACQSEKDGLKSVKSALKELVQFGYAELLTSVDPKTKKFTGKFYKVRDYSKKHDRQESNKEDKEG